MSGEGIKFTDMPGVRYCIGEFKPSDRFVFNLNTTGELLCEWHVGRGGKISRAEAEKMDGRAFTLMGSSEGTSIVDVTDAYYPKLKYFVVPGDSFMNVEGAAKLEIPVPPTPPVSEIFKESKDKPEISHRR